MFERAFLQELGGGRLRHEETLVAGELARRGVPFERYVIKRIERRQLPLTRACFVTGDLDCVHGALRQLGAPVPELPDYPPCFAPFLRRRVWRSTLAAVAAHVHEGAASVFAKPAGRRKRFTGAVFASPGDLAAAAGASRREEVWCSEVVRWRSEHRVYVVDHEPVATCRYDGDEREAVDPGAVREALAAFRASGAAPAGYGVDFGVLDTGETALVEVNDGYALGAYGIEAAPYTELLLARWRELVAVAEKPSAPASA